MIAREKERGCNCNPTVDVRHQDERMILTALTHEGWCKRVHPKWRSPRPS